jgi:AraC-like DNA-binding protein
MDIVWDGSQLWLVGPDTGPVTVSAEQSFAGIRFRPGSAPGFFGLAAPEVRDRSVPLAHVWGPAAELLAEQLGETPEAADCILERALLARIERAAPMDPLIEPLLAELVTRPPGPSTTSALAARLGASERTLRRRTIAALGYGPKTLQRIVRFRRAVRLVRRGRPLSIAAIEAGYADQAHLSHECRRLAGISPLALATGPHLAQSANGLD